MHQGSTGDTTWGMLLPVGSEQDRTWLLEKTRGEKNEHSGGKNEIQPLRDASGRLEVERGAQRLSTGENADERSLQAGSRQHRARGSGDAKRRGVEPKGVGCRGAEGRCSSQRGGPGGRRSLPGGPGVLATARLQLPALQDRGACGLAGQAAVQSLRSSGHRRPPWGRRGGCCAP